MLPSEWVVASLQVFINPHQRCGYSDSPFARIYFSILQVPETDLREWIRCVHTQKNRKPYQKDTFLMEKCFEDVRQDEKHVPDLLEAIMRPKLFVKERVTANVVQNASN